MRGDAHGVGMRQVQAEPPAVFVVGLGAHRAQFVQARAQAAGVGRQPQFAVDAAQAEALAQGDA
jgi:hypothetical protein